MKQLILFRHAKTEEASNSGKDFDRNLLDTGIHAAEKISEYFKLNETMPGIILCSKANRTMQTCEIFKNQAGYYGEIVYLNELYHASSSAILDIATERGKGHDIVMVIGHNMGISQLAALLCENSCEELPTAGMALINFKGEPEPYAGQLKSFLSPKAI